MKFCRKLFSLLPQLALMLGVSVLVAENVVANQDTSDISKARLIAATYAIGDTREITFGVHVTMEAGWKTYWRSPGDAGIAPKFSWDGSTNIEDVKVHWPAPTSFDSFGFLTWGYEGEVVFPVTARIKNQGSDLSVKLNFDYGVCSNVCVPISESMVLNLPAGSKTPTPYAPLIAHFQGRVPNNISSDTHIHGVNLESRPDNILEVALNSSKGLRNPQIILEGDEGDYFEIGSPMFSSDGNRAVFKIKADFIDKKREVKGREIIATIIDRDHAIEAVVAIK